MLMFTKGYSPVQTGLTAPRHLLNCTFSVRPDMSDSPFGRLRSSEVRVCVGSAVSAGHHNFMSPNIKGEGEIMNLF